MLHLKFVSDKPKGIVARVKVWVSLMGSWIGGDIDVPSKQAGGAMGLLNQTQMSAHSRGRLWVCAWILESVFWKVRVSMYVYLFVFPHRPRKQTIKL